MRTKTRTAAPAPKSLAPTDRQAWQNLMLAALKRAEQVGQNTNSMQVAYVRGQSEQALRKLGIICQADLDRLYPLK